MRLYFNQSLSKNYYSYFCYSDKFARSNEVEEMEKATFPYEYWSDILDIRNCSSFPSYEHFRSSLMRPNATFCDEFVEIVEKEIALGRVESIRFEKNNHLNLRFENLL